MRIKIIILFLLIAKLNQAANLKAGKPDAWVNVKDVENIATPKSSSIANGAFLKSLDIQVNIPLQKEYHRSVYLLMNETGVQNYSQIRVRFDPSYQAVVFHTIKLIRGNTSIDILKLNDFKVVQEENDLSRFIYNGTSTAFLIPKDVRVGDVLEYSYTIEGFNPVFNGSYYETFYFQGSSPVGAVSLSIIVPKGKDLYYLSNNGAPEPHISRNVDQTNVYTWVKTSIGQKLNEDFQPISFNDYPNVQVSQMNSWEQVVRWGLTISPDLDKVDKELADFIIEAKRATANEEEYLRKCIRFVQDEVRYMGIEVSAYSHMPHDPSQTFNKRYGDCKDKSYLLCALLRAYNIEANPVYINTYATSNTSQLLPSPLDFNHCVVRYYSHYDYHYIDPTISLQRGPILKTYFPNYGQGLVIHEGQSGLTGIYTYHPGSVVVNEKICLKKTDESGSLQVFSKFSGYQADVLRATLQEESRETIQQLYLDYYSEAYDSVSVSKALEVKDDEMSNEITTVENYDLKRPWEEIKDKKDFYSFLVSARPVKDRLIILPAKKRETPVGLNYPLNIQYTMEVETPKVWTIQEERVPIKNEFFDFNYSIKKIEKGFILSYDYSTLRADVPVGSVSRYNSEIQKVLKNLGYQLTWNPKLADGGEEVSNRTNLPFAIIAIFLLISFSFIAWRVNRLSLTGIREQNYYSVGGWMMLQFIGMIFSFFQIVYMFFTQGFFDQTTLEAAKNNLGPGAINLDVVYIFEISANIYLLVLLSLTIYCFIERRDITPRLIVVLLTSHVLIVAMDQFFVKALGPDYATAIDIKGMARSIVAAIIWIPYYQISERVKGTFVVPFGGLPEIKYEDNRRIETTEVSEPEQEILEEPKAETNDEKEEKVEKPEEDIYARWRRP